MERIHYTSWTFHEKHGGPAHRTTTTTTTTITVTVPPITKPTHGMDSDSDSSDYEEPPVPISEIDRESAIILAVLAFLCIVACFWFYRQRTKTRRRADLERQFAQEREDVVSLGRTQGRHVKSASISFQMKSRSERTDSDASKGSHGVVGREHQRHISWPKITFSRTSEPAALSENYGWHRQDSMASTIAPRSLDESVYHERGRPFSYRPAYARYGNRIIYSNPLPPCESALHRSSIPHARCAKRCCTEIGPHGIMPPNQDWARRQSLREPPTIYDAPGSMDGLGDRNQNNIPHRGRTCSRRVYDWSRPMSKSPSTPEESDSRGATLGGS